MKIPANSLEAFLAVARLKHFTKAAEQLGITQSALSQRILNLESQLETTFFVRDRTGAKLTEEGERLLGYAKMQEALEEEFLAQQSGQMQGLEGSLRVGAFSSVSRSLVLPALAPLLRENPSRLSLLSREMEELPDLLRRGETDLILLDHPLERENISSDFLGFEENVLVRARRGKQANDWFLDHDANDLTTFRYLQKFGGKSKKLDRRFLDDVYGLIDGVKLGLGQSVLPLHLVEDDKDLEIVGQEKVLKLPVWLHYPSQSYYPKLQQMAREAIQSYAEQKLAKK